MSTSNTSFAPVSRVANTVSDPFKARGTDRRGSGAPGGKGGNLRVGGRIWGRYRTNGQLDLSPHNPTISFMPKSTFWIAVVDDDPSVLKALSRLLRARAFEAETYGSAREFLAALPEGLP